MKLKVNQFTIKVSDKVVTIKGDCFIDVPMPFNEIRYGQPFSVECHGVFSELPPAPGDAMSDTFMIKMIDDIVDYEAKVPKIVFVGRREYDAMKRIAMERRNDVESVNRIQFKYGTEKICFKYEKDFINIIEIDKDSYLNISFY